MSKATEKPNPRYPKRVKVHVTKPDIDGGISCDPNKCMIKVAVARAIKVPHGYIHVDARGVSVTRRPDYREKSDLSREATKNLLLFDNAKTRHLVAPFSFWLDFRPTTKIVKRDAEKTNALRRARVAAARSAGKKPKKYSLHTRVAGIAVPKEFADQLDAA